MVLNNSLGKLNNFVLPNGKTIDKMVIPAGTVIYSKIAPDVPNVKIDKSTGGTYNIYVTTTGVTSSVLKTFYQYGSSSINSNIYTAWDAIALDRLYGLDYLKSSGVSQGLHDVLMAKYSYNGAMQVNGGKLPALVDWCKDALALTALGYNVTSITGIYNPQMHNETTPISMVDYITSQVASLDLSQENPYGLPIEFEAYVGIKTSHAQDTVAKNMVKRMLEFWNPTTGLLNGYDMGTTGSVLEALGLARSLYSTETFPELASFNPLGTAPDYTLGIPGNENVYSRVRTGATVDVSGQSLMISGLSANCQDPSLGLIGEDPIAGLDNYILSDKSDFSFDEYGDYGAMNGANNVGRAFAQKYYYDQFKNNDARGNYQPTVSIFDFYHNPA